MAKRSGQGASKRSNSKSAHQMPGWLWLVTGVALGLFVAFLYHLSQIQQHTSESPDKQQGQQAAQQKTAKQHKNLPKFDFYAVLPKMEEVVPNHRDDTAEKPGDSAKTANHSSSETSHEKANNTSVATASSAEKSGRYMLQAGSFRDEQAAQRRRADFTLQGYDVKVQPGKLDSGVVWYRVMIGPFASKAALHQTQDKLSAKHVDTLAIHLKSD